jgi:hypothetical protein
MQERFSPLEVPPFYRNYVERVNDMELIEALTRGAEQVQETLSTITELQGDSAYLPGKWTIKELLCHMIDAERVFAYRAMCFSRNDPTSLPGFDENAYAPEANASGRSIVEIGQELSILRQSTIMLFKSFSSGMLHRRGVANNSTMSVTGLGYVIAGHENHHLQILRERYLRQQ